MISVIVPYWNSAKWICRCVSSLKLNRGEFEFIFVNDHSEDDGEEIAREAAAGDERFLFINNENRRGPSGARNTGLDIATGDWIAFLDADDMMNAGAFEIFTDAIRRAGDHNIIQFDHYRHYSKSGKTALKYTNRPGDYDLRRMPVLWCVVWNKLYKAELIKDIRFDESMLFGEDELFNVYCLAKDGRIRCAKGVSTTHVFENQESLSKTKTEDEILKHGQMLVDVIRRHKDPELRRAVCLRLAEHWSHLFLDVLSGEK